MEQIMEDATKDAAKSGIICRYIVSEVSYHEFLKGYENNSAKIAAKRQMESTEPDAHGDASVQVESTVPPLSSAQDRST